MKSARPMYLDLREDLWLQMLSVANNVAIMENGLRELHANMESPSTDFPSNVRNTTEGRTRAPRRRDP